MNGNLNLGSSGRKTIVVSLESALLGAGAALLSRHGIAFCGAGTSVPADGELMLQVMTDGNAKVPDIYLPKWVDPRLGRVLQTGIDQFWERKGDVELVWAGERAPVKMGIIRIPKGEMVGQRVLMGISWALVTWQANQKLEAELASEMVDGGKGPAASAAASVADQAAPAAPTAPTAPTAALTNWKSYLSSQATTNSLLLAILLFLLLTLGAQLSKAQQSTIPARLIDPVNNAMRVVCISGCAGVGGGGGGVIVDGVNNTIQATVLDYANSNPIAVRLTDTSGNYVGAGAGTQYATGTTQATPTGTLALGYDGTVLRHLLTSAAGRLSVDINSLVAIPTGSNTIGGVNLAQYTPVSGRLPVDGSGVTQPVSGTITANLGTIADVATQTTLSAVNGKLPALSGGRVPVEATGSGKFDIFPTSPVATTYIAVRLTDGTSFYSASGGGGDGAILDGVSSSIKATVFDYANANPVSVRLTDTNGDYVGAGAGTQYATGTAVGTPTGTAALGHDGANVRALLTSAAGRLSVDINSLVAIPTGSNTIGAVNLAQYTPASGRLPVDGSGVTQPVSGTITANAGTGNFGANITQVGGNTVNAGTGNSGTGTLRVVLATDQPQLTNKLLVTPDANSAVNLAQFGGNAVSSGNGTSGTGTQRVAVASDNSAVANWGQGATGAAVPSGAVYMGARSSGNLTGVIACDNWTPFSITTGTQIITGTSSQHVYVCSIQIVTATAQNIALVSGTGTVCATGTGGMAGGTTAATGWNFAANGGLTQGTGFGVVARTVAAADNVCLLTSSSGQISGVIGWTKF